MKKVGLIALIGFLTGFAGLYVGLLVFEDRMIAKEVIYRPSTNHIFEDTTPSLAREVDLKEQIGALSDRPDFVAASEISTASVVFVTTLSEYEYRTGTVFDWFFEPRTSRRVGSGSGVIVSDDGYIVTNNHVINDAAEIKVTLGKRTYQAELVGIDPSTDLAVLRIDDTDLPEIPLANSADVKVGEWVLAVGNPFNLTSTVTAGIVSAKGRNINILRDKFPIESFIQTDAAINPGNSGGALVNANGELIGINTAILSQTGSYAGYGFAVPVDIVKKVFNDIVKYGEVQKAFFGADLVEIDDEVAARLELSSLEGVLVNNVRKKGAAEKAGLESGDVIVSLNAQTVNNVSQAEEYIANLYPGDELVVEIMRNDKTVVKPLVLFNRNGGTDLLRRETYYSDFLDAEFEIVSQVELDLLEIENGIKIIDYNPRGYFAGFELPKGFIITAINRRNISKPEELEEILSRIKGRVEIYGINEEGRKVYVPFYMR